jgi:hypothetical protein
VQLIQAAQKRKRQIWWMQKIAAV